MHVCLPARSVSASRVHFGTGGEVGRWSGAARHVAVTPKREEKTELSGRGLSREQGPSNAWALCRGLSPILVLGHC